MSKLISIVTPAFNESENLPLLVQEILSVKNASLPNYDLELIIVNDGSKDATWQTIVALSASFPFIKGLNLSRQFGHQIALTAGLDLAKGDVIIYCDSDLQHPPALFPELIASWENGYDIVNTYRRKTEDISFTKNFFSKLFYSVINSMTEIKISEGMSDYKLLDRKVLDELKKMREHNRFLRGMVPWLGFKSTVVEFDARKRQHGKSWYSFGRSLAFAKKAILSFSTQPLRLIGYIGLLTTLLALTVILAYVLLALVYDSFLFDTLGLMVLVNTFLIGLTLASLGVIALYLNFVYDEVTGRPLYVIKDIIQHE
jgi:glycosyltransferase involved in cell wall biosynthesis